MPKRHELKFLDLFAGVGGFRLGMEKAGHKCVGYVEWDKFARKSYQAIHDVKKEYTEHDIRAVVADSLPKADVWCFGFPCQDISVAGGQGGFSKGKRSSLFFTVTGIIRKLKEKDKPTYLFIENVKNLLSINGGWDFAKLLIELDEIGYDAEWDVLNSAEVVPQNRERVFIIGHLRGRGSRKVFPITGQSENIVASDGEPKISQVGNISSSTSFGGNPQMGRVYGINGISPYLNTMQGGGREPKIAIFGNISPTNHYSATVYNPIGIIGAILAHDAQTPKMVVYPVIASDRHGILFGNNTLAIRKITPKECWRLQGFPDEAFDKAEKVNSNSQLYKQAGNSVTVTVIAAIAERLGYYARDTWENSSS